MEDVIFSGTANKPSKNIAEVMITLNNSEKDGPIQFRDVEKIDVDNKADSDSSSNSREFIIDFSLSQAFKTKVFCDVFEVSDAHR